jgi:hypothetical protein
VHRISVMIYLSLIAGPLLAHAEEPVQYEIEAFLVACPTNAVVTTPNSFDPLTLPANWTVLSSPIVVTLARQEADIQISEKPCQYFVKQSDGSFQLLQMSHEDEPGFTLAVTVTPLNRAGIVNLKVKFKFSSIVKREELPGVSLDVGKPTIVSSKQEFGSELKLGSWVINNLPGFIYPGSDNSGRAMLLFLRAQRVKGVDASGRPITE